jgi:VIT1/CCC1 family predicted Fe2+/Mn2+ transporter
MLVAAGLLTWMIFWMRRQARTIRSHLETEVQRALTQGSALGLAVVAFVGVLREGVETAVFLFGSFEGANRLTSSIGAAVGLAGAVALGYLFYRGSDRLDLRRFFTWTSGLLLLFAAYLFAGRDYHRTVSGIERARLEPPPAADRRRAEADRRFLLQVMQPAMVGLIDGSLSTLAPIFSVALATHRPHYAFFAGLATAIGAGVSMAFSEGLSDTGELTGRGRPYVRGAITGAGTFLGGIAHTLPFLIADYRTALTVAIVVVAVELLLIAWVRWRWFPGTSVASSIAQVTLAGAIVFAVGLVFGAA